MALRTFHNEKVLTTTYKTERSLRNRIRDVPPCYRGQDISRRRASIERSEVAYRGLGFIHGNKTIKLTDLRLPSLMVITVYHLPSLSRVAEQTTVSGLVQESRRLTYVIVRLLLPSSSTD